MGRGPKPLKSIAPPPLQKCVRARSARTESRSASCFSLREAWRRACACRISSRPAALLAELRGRPTCGIYARSCHDTVRMNIFPPSFISLTAVVLRRFESKGLSTKLGRQGLRPERPSLPHHAHRPAQPGGIWLSLLEGQGRRCANHHKAADQARVEGVARVCMMSRSR